MKNLASKIYVFILLVALTGSALSGYCQSAAGSKGAPLTEVAKMRRSGVAAWQTGTATLQQGKAVVSLSAETMAKLNDPNFTSDYYVVLTPVGGQASLALSVKGKDSFTIEAADAGNYTVDYIVFIHTQLIPAPVTK